MFGISKFNTMVDSEAPPTKEGIPTPGTARFAIYDSSLELIAEKPILGYGVGQFQRVWHEKKIDYTRRYPDSNPLIVRLSHPHNELLYWTIEGGLVALSGILAMIGAFLISCWRIGWQRGGAYLAVLLPITLHTQTELPLYISHLHWILFIVLVGFVAQHHIKPVSVRISSAFKIVALTVSLAIPVLGSAFFTHCLLSVDRLISLHMKKVTNIDELRLPSSNLYFNQRATLIQMKILLQIASNEGNMELLRKYEAIAKEYLQFTPDTAVYKGLIFALQEMSRFDESHQLLNKLVLMYPTAPEILDFQRKVMVWDKQLGIYDRYWKLKAVQQPE